MWKIHVHFNIPILNKNSSVNFKGGSITLIICCKFFQQSQIGNNCNYWIITNQKPNDYGSLLQTSSKNVLNPHEFLACNHAYWVNFLWTRKIISSNGNKVNFSIEGQSIKIKMSLFFLHHRIFQFLTHINQLMNSWPDHSKFQPIRKQKSLLWGVQ